MVQNPNFPKDRLCLFLPSLHGGGAERVMLNLARAFSKLGLKVDLVLVRAEGVLLAEVPNEVRVVDLEASRVLLSLGGLVRYLRSERPVVILSAIDNANVISLMAAKLSRVPARTVVSIHTNVSNYAINESSLKTRLIRYWIRPFYRKASAIVAVSQGVADDLIRFIGLKPEIVKVIYNPVVGSEFFINAAKPLDHPWFKAGEPPVILGIGRLTSEKNFSDLIRAFDAVKAKRRARLMILGEGEERVKLHGMIKSLRLDSDVSLPGFVMNPLAFLRASALFVMTSKFEGFGNVLVEAMACGTPVVSTDCPSGPYEILEGGRWGRLVPVGDVRALEEAILEQIDSAPPVGTVESAKARFHEDLIALKYLNIMVGH